MKKKIIFILVTIVAIVLIVLGVVLIGFNNDNNSHNNTSNTDDTSSNQMSVGLPDSNNYKENKDGSMTNTSTKISKQHTSGDFIISNMTISMPNDEDFFVDYEYTIENNCSTDYNSLQVSVVFKFSDGSELVSSADIVENLAAGTSIKVNGREYISVLGAVDYDVKIESVE